MVQVTAVGDLLVAQTLVRARDDGGDDIIKSVVASGAHVGVQDDLLAACEARLEGAGLFERKHEGKGFGRREAVEMPPAYEIVVVARPAGALVLRIAQHPGGAVTF